MPKKHATTVYAWEPSKHKFMPAVFPYLEIVSIGNICVAACGVDLYFYGTLVTRSFNLPAHILLLFIKESREYIQGNHFKPHTRYPRKDNASIIWPQKLGAPLYSSNSRINIHNYIQ